MSLDPTRCPYCNSTTLLPAGTQPGQRVTCQRCGETFAYRGPPVTDAPSPVPSPTNPVPVARPRRSNAAVALAVLGGMLLMAEIGIDYALQTQDVRRDHDSALPKSRAVAIPPYLRAILGAYVVALVAALVWGWNRGERAAERGAFRRRLVMPALALFTLGVLVVTLVLLEGRPARQMSGDGGTTAVRRIPPADGGTTAVRRIPPAELPALGYLPPGTNAIVAVHVAEARDDPVGKQALARLKFGGVGADGLEAWSGLKLDDMDHAVLGLVLDEQPIPRLTLVVQTRRPYDPEQVREALKVKRATERGGRTLHRFTLEQVGLEAHLWCAGERTLVVARKPEDFDRIPASPRSGIEHLPEPLQEFVTKRMGPSAQAWAAGHVETWDKVGVLLVLEGLFKQDWETLRGVRTFGTWLLCDGGATLSGSFRCADEATATALGKRLGGDAEGGGLKALGLRPDGDPMLQEFARTLKTVQDGAWVDLQAKSPGPEGPG